MKKTLLTALAAMLFLACAREEIREGNPEPSQAPEEEIVTKNFVPSIAQKGSAIIYLDDTLLAWAEEAGSEGEITKASLATKANALDPRFAELGIKSMERLFPYDEEFEERTRRENLHRYYKVEFEADVTPTKACSMIESVPGILNVEFELATKTYDLPNDPHIAKQWHYYNDGKATRYCKVGCDINVLPVWEEFGYGDPKVKVADVDGGFLITHEDLAWNIAGTWNSRTNSTTVTANDHGCHTAGTIAAVNNNGKGGGGIAGGDYKSGKKGVSLYVLQELSAANIKKACDMGCVVVNNSWGYDFSDSNGNFLPDQAKSAADYGLQRFSSSLASAIDYFTKYGGCDNKGNQLSDSAMKGGVVFFAAGNEDYDRNVIGEYKNVVAVGSVAPNYERAYYSCYGDWVAIAAPGGDQSLGNASGVYSCVSNGGYQFYQGTSMACPHATGTAALALSYCGGPNFTREMLLEAMIETSRNVITTNNKKYIANLIDAYGMTTYWINSAPDSVKKADVAAPVIISNNIEVTFTPQKNEKDTYPTYYYLVAGQSASDVLAFNPRGATVQSTDLKYSVITVPAGYKGSAPLSGRVSTDNFNSDYYLAVIPTNNSKQYTALSEKNLIKIKTLPNEAPAVTFATEAPSASAPVRVNSHQSATVTFTVTDAAGHYVPETDIFSGDIAIVKNLTSKVLKDASLDKVEYSFEIDGKANPNFTDKEIAYELVIKVMDKYNTAREVKVPYVILPNHEPSVPAEEVRYIFTSFNQKMDIDLSTLFEDLDGEDLTYTIDKGSYTSYFEASVAGNKLSLKTKNISKAVTIQVKASDYFATLGKSKPAVLRVRVIFKDPKHVIETYPNPVIDDLYIRTIEEDLTSVTIYSLSGGVLYQSAEGLKSSVWKPIVVDMRGYAPGQYRVEVSYKGSKVANIITKQ